MATTVVGSIAKKTSSSTAMTGPFSSIIRDYVYSFAFKSPVLRFENRFLACKLSQFERKTMENYDPLLDVGKKLFQKHTVISKLHQSLKKVCYNNHKSN